LLVSLGPARARADDGSAPRGCISLAVVDVTPATVEMDPWLRAAVGTALAPSPADRSRHLAWDLGAGTAATLRLLGSPYSAPSLELRGGPWLGLGTNLRTLVLEGGGALAMGDTGRSDWLAFGLRGGVSYPVGEGVAGVVALTWGFRDVPRRDRGERAFCRRRNPPAAFALSRMVRGALSLYRQLRGEPDYRVMLGIELDLPWPLSPEL
jgi:hypothetical protein